MPPFFTIITATYNAAVTLPRLLESLAAQTCRDFELVVQDGASTDDTLAVIEAWRSRLPAVSVESAPDAGIYDAWNRALDRQGDDLGQWVLFLGADDFLAEMDILEKVRTRTNVPVNIKFLAGNISLINVTGIVENSIASQVNVDKAMLYRGMPLANPATFYRKNLFGHQRFDVTFRILGDYDFVASCWTDAQVARSLDMLVSYMLIGGISTSMRGRVLTWREAFRIGIRYAPRYLVVCRTMRTILLDGLYILCKKIPILEPLRQRLRAWYRRVMA